MIPRNYDPSNPSHRKRNAEYQRKWYKANRDKRIKQVADRKKKLSEWLRDYKRSLSCKQCGFSHPAALDFHHRDPSSKKEIMAGIAWRGWGKERILEEASKCDILCSNCHRILHYEEKQLSP